MTRRTRPLTAADAAPAAPGSTPSPGGHLFTMTEAADACEVSRDTIKRHRQAGAYPGAHQDAAGTWLIPLADLLADGLTPNAPLQGEGAPQAQHQVPAPPAAPPAELERLRRLESENRELRARLEERERALSIAETALRALPAAPAAPPVPQDAAPPRRPWWRR